MKVAELIRHAMPEGTRGKGRWRDCPWWPPDLFAVTALLAERTTAYTILLSAYGRTCELCTEQRRTRLQQVARSWRRDDWPVNGRYRKDKAYLQKLWDRLFNCQSEVCPSERASLTEILPDDWRLAALELMIIADLASAGVGFYPSKDSDERLNWIKRGFLVGGFEGASTHDERARGSSPSYQAQHANFNACKFVTPAVACVQPKTRTPRVGCTLRSLSHHLALLPPDGTVRARWNVYEHKMERADSHVFNLLAVPFPYSVRGSSFVNQDSISEHGQGLFAVRQTWLKAVPKEAFAAFVMQLIAAAKREVQHVDGIVFPEMALDGGTYEALVNELMQAGDNRVQVLVAGVLGGGEQPAGSFNNAAATTVFCQDEANVCFFSMQKKHHRWKLDSSQIIQYSLGEALDPEIDWWENARIDNRDMMFYVFRKGACFTTLVCEDLARADPGQQVIRAIGPNIVIALLMDGPQLGARWPGRYAMGLADDPGSSVLSLTSLGLVLRSNLHYGTNSRAVGLWRDATSGTRQLDLPVGSQALLLSLTSRCTTEYTLDGRSDGGHAYEWVLSGCLPVRCDKVPSWASN